MEEMDYELSKAKIIETIKNIKKSSARDEIKRYYANILSILTYHQAIIDDIDLNALKHTGLKFAMNEFLELLAMADPNKYNIFFDAETIMTLTTIIYEYLQREYNNFKGIKQADLEINKPDTAALDVTSSEERHPNPINTEKSSTGMENHKGDSEDTEFYIDYIDDPTVNCIIELFSKTFLESKNVYLLKLMHENAFFSLIGIIVTDNSCHIYQNIFKNKVYFREKNEHHVKAPKGPSSLAEIQRKLFEPHTIVKEKAFIDEYEISTENIMVDDSIYLRIAEELFSRNLFFIIHEMGIKSIIHPVLFLFEYKSNLMSRDPNEFISMFYNDEVIFGLNETLFGDESVYFIKLHSFLLKHLNEQEKSKILFCKLVLDSNQFEKVMKSFQKADIYHKKTFFVWVYLLLRHIETFDKYFEEEINIKDYIRSTEIMKQLKYIIDLLNYKFEERRYIVKLVRLLYKYGDKAQFYKISYYIIYRHVIFKYDEIFARLIFSDILKYHQSSLYNFPKILFDFKPRKDNKANFIKNSPEHEIEDETIVEDKFIGDYSDNE